MLIFIKKHDRKKSRCVIFFIISETDSGLNFLVVVMFLVCVSVIWRGKCRRNNPLLGVITSHLYFLSWEQSCLSSYLFGNWKKQRPEAREWCFFFPLPWQLHFAVISNLFLNNLLPWPPISLGEHNCNVPFNNPLLFLFFSVFKFYWL